LGAERQVEALGHEDPNEVRIPPPVRGGTRYLESLGRWFDNLLGDELIHRSAQRDLAPRYLGEDETPPDPSPSEPPPPVPDGTGTSTRGGSRGEREAPPP